MLERNNIDIMIYGLLKEFARENRRNQTDAESFLWQNLKGGRLACRFLRQFIIDKYIVDFVCRETKLIIEVDGSYHSELEQMQYDEDRTQALQKLGYRVIRFSNEQVVSNIEDVLHSIIIEL